jgi:hypothetical protein
MKLFLNSGRHVNSLSQSNFWLRSTRDFAPDGLVWGQKKNTVAETVGEALL